MNLKLKLLPFLFLALVNASAQPGFEDDVDDLPLDASIYYLVFLALLLGIISTKILVQHKKVKL